MAKIVECPHCGHPQRVVNKLYFLCEKCKKLARINPTRNGKAKIA